MYIRKAGLGDEKALAYIQTESWKAAFADILPPDELQRCTDLQNTEQMYRNVLSRGSIHTAIQFVDGDPHCITAWSKNRCELGDDVAELICIHSLRDRWRKGYGSAMMKHVLAEIRQAGYSSVILWVFAKNTPARRFYEKHRFVLTHRQKQANGILELMYIKSLQ